MPPESNKEPERSSRMLVILMAVVIAVAIAVFLILRPTSGGAPPANPAGTHTSAISVERSVG